MSSIRVRDLAQLASGGHKVLLIADGSRVGDGSLGEIALQFPGFAVLSATRGDELEFEGPQFGGSPLANALVSTLGQPIPDLDRDGLISIDELYFELYRKMTAQIVSAKGSTFVPHPGLFAPMGHHMFVSQAQPTGLDSATGLTLQLEGSLLDLVPGSRRFVVNGTITDGSINQSNHSITLGESGTNVFRQGLNWVIAGGPCLHIGGKYLKKI